MSIALTSLSICVLFGWNLWTNYFHHKFYLFYIFLNAILSYHLWVFYNPAYAVFAFYLLNNSSYFALNSKAKHFSHPQGGVNQSLLTVMNKSYITIIASCLLMIWVKFLDFEIIIQSMKIALGVNIVLTLLPKKWTMFKTECGHKAPICGFGANISTNATLLSLMAPFAMINFNQNLELNLTLLIFTLIAILKTTATVGLVAILSSLSVFFILVFDLSTQSLIIAPIASLPILAIGAFLIKKFKPRTRLLSISGRDNIFRFTRKWIMPRMNKYFGIGVGSFQFVFPTTHKMVEEQSLNQYRIANYIWLHNDILQFFIEGGWVGLTLGVLTYAHIFIICIGNHNYAGVSFLVAYFVNSLGNFPNHLVPDLVTCLLMFCFIGL